MATAKCPDCDADIEVPNDAVNGEIVSCPDCGLDLEVRKAAGGIFDLKQVSTEKEDWGE